MEKESSHSSQSGRQSGEKYDRHSSGENNHSSDKFGHGREDRQRDHSPERRSNRNSNSRRRAESRSRSRSSEDRQRDRSPERRSHRYSRRRSESRSRSRSRGRSFDERERGRYRDRRSRSRSRSSNRRHYDKQQNRRNEHSNDRESRDDVRGHNRSTDSYSDRRTHASNKQPERLIPNNDRMKAVIQNHSRSNLRADEQQSEASKLKLRAVERGSAPTVPVVAAASKVLPARQDSAGSAIKDWYSTGTKPDLASNREMPYICSKCTLSYMLATQLSDHLQSAHDYRLHPSLIKANKPQP